MNELIKIVENDGKKAVSARELYEKLGFDLSQWSRWYKKNITGNEFAIKNQDYIELDTMSRTTDFALSIDFAKRLSMMARTETGEQIRNYFIEIEKRATKPLSQLDILAQSIQILQAQEKRISEIDDRVKVIEAKQTTHQDWFTIAGYGTLLKIQVGIKLAASLDGRHVIFVGNLALNRKKYQTHDSGKSKPIPKMF